MDVRVRGKATARPKEVKGPTLGKMVGRTPIAPGAALMHAPPRAVRRPVGSRASERRRAVAMSITLSQESICCANRWNR